MKRIILLTSVICVFALMPSLYSQVNKNNLEDAYVADDEGYDEMDDEFYESEDEDTPLAEMDPIYQNEED